VWVPVAELEKKGSRFKFIRILHKDIRGPQEIFGPTMEDAMAECPIAEEGMDADEDADVIATEN
jgi:hypothetical protein